MTGTIATWISRQDLKKKLAKAVGPPSYSYQKCTTLKVVEFAHILIILAFGQLNLDGISCEFVDYYPILALS